MKHINDGTQYEAIYDSLKEIFPDDNIEKKTKVYKMNTGILELFIGIKEQIVKK